MSTRTFRSASIALALSAAIALPTSAAPSFRAYLSAAGRDDNPCTLAAPCRLLPAAVAAVADGGEIWILDSANFNTGQVLVTKSVSILAVPGALGSLVTTAQSALQVEGAGATVALRNLVIGPLPGSAAPAIQVYSGSLRMEHCVVNRTDSGVELHLSASAVIADSVFRDHGTFAIAVDSGSSVVVSRTHVSGSWMGIWIIAGESTAHVTDSVMNDNFYGLYVSADTGVARAYVSRTTFTGNMNAVTAHSGTFPANGYLEISGNLIAKNANGLRNEGGLVHSAVNNRIAGNVNDTYGSITPASSY